MGWGKGAVGWGRRCFHPSGVELTLCFEQLLRRTAAGFLSSRNIW